MNGPVLPGVPPKGSLHVRAGVVETLDSEQPAWPNGEAGEARQTIRALVRRILATKSLAQPFSDEDTLAEIGVGSADMIELLLAVESAFDLEVPQADITPESFRSVASVGALVARLRPHAMPGEAVRPAVA